MNKSISIVLALTSVVLLVSFGKTDAACGDAPITTSSTSPSPDTNPVGYCKQFYTAPGANTLVDCSVGRDNDCGGGLVCIYDGNGYYLCECPLYKSIQSQIYNNALDGSTYTCTSPLLDQSGSCWFRSGSPCGRNWFCASNRCSNSVCD